MGREKSWGKGRDWEMKGLGRKKRWGKKKEARKDRIDEWEGE